MRDVARSRHSILVNYPAIRPLRFLLAYIRPKIRQYFNGRDRETVQIARQQRADVHRRATSAPDKQPFGTQLDIQGASYE